MTNIYEKTQGAVEIVLQVLLADHFVLAGKLVVSSDSATEITYS